MTFCSPCTTVSISCWNDEGYPRRPIGDVTHWNWPFPGTVKAMYGRDFGWRSICQKPSVRSIVVKRQLPERPISPMHSLTSFIKYLSTWVSEFRARKSCTKWMPLFFFATANIGLLYLLRGWLNDSHFQPFGDMFFDLITMHIWNAKLFHINWLISFEQNFV